MKTVTLCADDFALNEAVSRAIVELAEAGRLSAVSCMSVSPLWRAHASWLQPLHGRVEVGLHVTLTGVAPLGAMRQLAPGGVLPGLGKVLGGGVLHRLPRAEIAAELRRQMAAFLEQFGRAPDFLDGHQHVHLLPGVRETVLELWEEHLKPHGGYLRSCHEPLGAIVRRGVEPVKAQIISGLSAPLTRQAGQRGIPINDSFRGVHDFSGKTAPEALFPRFLQGAGVRPLIMCHPGRAADYEDELRVWRPREFAYFAGTQFQSDLAAAGVRLGPLPRA